MFAYYHDGTHDSFQSLLFGIKHPSSVLAFELKNTTRMKNITKSHNDIKVKMAILVIKILNI